MNWIAEQFEKLKARVEAHIPATHQALNDLNDRVTALEAKQVSQVAVVDDGGAALRKAIKQAATP